MSKNYLKVIAVILVFFWAIPQSAHAQAILAYGHSTLSANQVVNADTTKAIFSDTVTMPSTGCPCRLRIDSSLYADVLGVASTWITDGTNVFGGSVWSEGTGGFYLTITSDAFSPVTYANNAVITITLNVHSKTAVTDIYSAIPSGFTGQGASWMDVAVIPSN
jgi:hypothetical protein